MSLNTTPRSERPHIALFGRRNSGKSSIINAITNQKIAIVSEVRGTTTDPVYKSMEILPLGSVVIIDTAGLDDKGALGELRIAKTLEVLDKTDIALVVVDGREGITDYDQSIIVSIKQKGLKPIVVFNKIDLATPNKNDITQFSKQNAIDVLSVSATTGEGIEALKKALALQNPFNEKKQTLIGDIITAGSVVVLVTPIDSAAPKGRLILPQQQVLRDVLDNDAIAIVCKDTELQATLKCLANKPDLVITDSQAFGIVEKIMPPDVALTGFSILFARYKGDLIALVKGAKAIASLRDGARILVAEGCTHHRQKDDIGTVKIPHWLNGITGKNFIYEHTAGMTFTEDVKKYDLIIHCGACMLNRRAVLSRIDQAIAYGVPIVNYGIVIAYVHDMMHRALMPFPEALKMWQG